MRRRRRTVTPLFFPPRRSEAVVGGSSYVAPETKPPCRVHRNAGLFCDGIPGGGVTVAQYRTVLVPEQCASQRRHSQQFTRAVSMDALWRPGPCQSSRAWPLGRGDQASRVGVHRCDFACSVCQKLSRRRRTHLGPLPRVQKHHQQAISTLSTPRKPTVKRRDPAVHSTSAAAQASSSRRSRRRRSACTRPA